MYFRNAWNHFSGKTREKAFTLPIRLKRVYFLPIMTSIALSSAPVSRPKVHRPPPLAPVTRKHRVASALVDYGTIAKFAFTISSVGLLLTLGVLFAHRFFPSTLREDVVVKTAIAVAPIADAQADSSQAKTIVLKEKDGAIVGQMTKIVPSVPPADIATSEIDNRKGRELLSIVNKY
jgi:hypothetical protein